MEPPLGRVYLPTPYPDEPLYGLLSRSIAHGGARSSASLSISLFGSPTAPSVDLPQHLERFATATWAQLGLGGSDSAHRLTLAPFYLAHLADARRASCLDELLVPSGRNVHVLLGIATSRVALPAWLRTCEDCRRAQRRDLGEAHWRRVHQIPGVLVCPEHGCPLSDTSVPYRTMRRVYGDAERAAARAVSRPSAAGRGPILEALAASCARMLDAEGAVERSRAVAAALHDSVRSGSEAGRLTGAMVDVFGSALLAELGCELDPGDRRNWFVSLIQSPARRSHPLQHALAEVFLSSASLDARGDPRIGQRESSTEAAVLSEREELKARWRALLRRVPGRDRQAAAEADPDLWSAIERALPGWASGARRKGNPRPSGQRRVDVAERDRDWAGRVHQAIETTRKALPPRRLTRSAILIEAALPRDADVWADRLPLYSAALADAHESVDHFHVRKLHHAADMMRIEGDAMTRTRLRARAKLTGPIGPLACATVAALQGSYLS